MIALLLATVLIRSAEPASPSEPLTDSMAGPGRPAESHGREPGKKEHGPAAKEPTTTSAPKARHAVKQSGHEQSSTKPSEGSKVAPDTGKPVVLCGRLPHRKMKWTRKQGILRLTGTTIIGPGEELELGPGVEVLVETIDACPDSLDDDHLVTLVVAGGRLTIAGKMAKPVRMVPSEPGRSLPWGGIRLERSFPGTVAISWLELVRARTGIAFHGGEGNVFHSVFEQCGIGIAVLEGASPRIEQSVVSHSLVAGAVSKKSAPRFVSCLFLEGQGDGIRFDGTGLASVRTSCFHGLAGQSIVRAPVGVGHWKSDTVADAFGNWQRDPVLRESASAAELAAKRQAELAKAPWWKPRRLPDDPPGTGPYALSPFSPLIDKGLGRMCRDVDGTACDIGLFGGK